MNKTWFSGLAVEGYDVVSYQLKSRAEKGDAKFPYEYLGAKWLFTSKEHLDLFKSDPGKYMPQYGGYCAYAVAKNSLAGIDPEVFAVVDGKLYLNYNKDIGEKWTKEQSDFIKKADTHWGDLKNE